MKQKITPEISELAGIFAADGSMQKAHICFWGNPKADREFYDNHLKLLFSKALNFSTRPHDKESNSVYGFYVCNPKIIRFFNEDLKFPFGSKTYTVTVPKLIYFNRDEEIIAAFIRGFFAGDGCLNFDKRYGKYQKISTILHTYPRIQIKCVSAELINQMSRMLTTLEIKSFISKKISKNENEVESYMLQVSGKVELEKWARIIRFVNPNHSTRYEIFKKYGFVPSNTSFEERISMIEGKISPWSYYPIWARSLAWIGRQ